MARWWVAVLVVFGGCAALPPVAVQPTPEPAACSALLGEVDAEVARRGVAVGSAARIDGFPHLRVDRLLASMAGELEGPAMAAVWARRLRGLDRQAREVELEGLQGWTPSAPGGGRLIDQVEGCAERMLEADLARPARIATLRARARVPDEYDSVRRVFGLYPLTSVPVHWAVRGLHARTRARFERPPEPSAERHRYVPPRSTHAPPIAAPARDRIGMPEFAPEVLERLFHAHAPVWEVDGGEHYDRPGAPRWHAVDRPAVDVRLPVTYRYLSHARWGGRILAQLNYVVWFDERPRRGAFDLLGGRLDGVVWRVTLADDGTALAYDSVHACGCYHLIFPAPQWRLRASALALAEPPLVVHPAPVVAAGQRLVVRLASATHYLQRVYADRVADAGATPYALREYRDLYRTEVEGGGRRSLFGANGLVVGTERRERFLLWPMGIESPGAMRERGRQPVAFVGRRHFDDPWLLQRFFSPVDERP